MLVSQVAENIKRAREDLRHTQESLARALDVSVRTIGLWETAATVPNRKNLEKLARELRHDPAWFYADNTEQKLAA